ncbi:MAG: pseudouridine synthase [Planctomycetota bacterium]
MPKTIDREIEILLETPDLLVAAKPVGLSTTSPPGTDSLEARLRCQCASKASYLHAVHRLDACVSGIVIFATRKKAARLLSQQFEARIVKKSYDAIVEGTWQYAGSVGELDGCYLWTDWLQKCEDQPRVRIANSRASGAMRAITRVRVNNQQVGLAHQTRLQLFPETGRMHQLRIQCASRGHRIVGDSWYRNDGLPEQSKAIALNASRIQFHDPTNATRRHVTCLPTRAGNPYFV